MAASATFPKVCDKTPRTTHRVLQRGVHRSTAELEADIDAFITTYNENPKPYRWVKSADQILKRFCQKTMSRTSDSGD
jgi:putative transposase